MPSVLDFLAFRQIGFQKSKKYVGGKKAVLDLLEYEAAKPTNNEPCEFSGEPRATFLVDFSPNMLRAASTHGDHSVRVTDIESGKCTHVLTGHPRTPWCLAFNPTSNDILASGCLGGEVHIWDLLGGGSEVLYNPSRGAVITSLAFHPSGQVLVFATINCIYFWDWSKPTPFAVTKTNHEYERIRWLRFDPFGKYLYTGIANNTTVHRDRARNIVGIGIRPTGSELREDRLTRARLLRNRLRYNQLMQRFRSFQRNQNQRAEYPENLRPRSPVHEENLNLARQYANHITENASVLNTRDNPGQRIHESNSRPGIIRDNYLPQNQDGQSNRPAADARTDGERLLNSRGWGRYQPSFFTTSAASVANESNNNSASATGFYENSRPLSSRPIRTHESRLSSSRLAPYAVREPSRTSRLGRMRYAFESSSSSPQTSSSTSSSSDDFEPSHRPEELEPDEFEILPVDQSESVASNAAGNEEGREFDGMSASEMAQRLEQQLRQLRRELFHLTQRNIDINSAIMTLPSHGSNQSSARADVEASESSSLPRSSFRSAGSALSRSMFSRSGNNNSSVMSSLPQLSTSSSSSILSSALSAISSSSTAAHSSTVNTPAVVFNSVVVSRSTPSSSSVPFISFAANSGVLRNSFSTANSSLSTNLATRTNNTVDNIPTTVTDNTSQTFGAMNLPEQLDRSTDMTGMGNEQCSRNSFGPDTSLPNRSTTCPEDNSCPVDSSSHGSDSSVVDSSSNLDQRSRINVCGYGNTPSLTQPLLSGQVSTTLSAHTTQTQLTTISNSYASSTHCSVPSLGILRSALSASSILPPISSPSSSSASDHVINSALTTSSSNMSNVSITRSAGFTSAQSLSSRLSALNDSRVFRSISSLRNSLSNMSEERLRSDNSTGERRRENLTSDNSEIPSTTNASTRSEMNASETASSAEGSNSNTALRTSIANVQRRISDVLHNIRTNQAQHEGSNASVEEVEHLRDVEYRFLSQTSQVLSQTTAYWTEFLGRSVMELNQRISDLERRLETNQYLLSSTNPFSHQRPGRPQDALMSSLFRSRAAPGNNSGRSIETDETRGSNFRSDDPPPPPSPSGGLGRDHAAGVRQAARGQIQRNQLLLDFLVWRGSRDSQSQRSLSFGQTVPNDLLSSSSSSSTSSLPVSLQAPILSSTLSASTTSASTTSTSSVPLSVTIHPSQDEDSEEEEEEDGNQEEEGMMRERGENGNRRRRRRGGEDSGGDSSWLGLQNVHLHPDYSSSILDDTINRPNETMQHIMNRTIAGVLDREEQAVASNIIPQTHRIQQWKISDVIVPSISKVSANIVVEQCKLHNDASCDISKDGTTLATFVPSHRGFPDDNILGVFSLRKETFAQCLYTKSFGPNAISVSISPANHYVMVGLAARRYFLFSLSNKMVCQVYKLVNEKAGEKSMKHVTDLFHPRGRGVQIHISVNFGRWLPGIGEGIVYGTNRGDLHFCRPGARRVPEFETIDMRSHQLSSSRRRGSVRSSIATQTTTVSIRRTASTQTQGEEDGAGPSR